ncbi:hypothetical protein [Demequina activiva]|uniref:Uncharacterized protein n=1 Tax=Demequina activiva TaxID=1582364 RepID=A0A919UHE3_9MICO|nr:hypothetical protein [Demequina activiva]GIG55329.1 hypothetical protein Dac01nite_20810 [Demequina activiva]
MADDASAPSGSEEAPAAPKRAPRKSPVRKPAATKAPATRRPAAANAAAPASASAQDVAPPADAASDAPAAEPPASAPAVEPSHSRSILDRVRENRVGPVTAGLIVALVVGLLLSVLVASEPSVLAMTILGALLAAAVGFAVRYLATGPSLLLQAETFLVTVIGIHLMGVTGMVGGDIPLLSELGAQGPGFNEALLVALATPPVSTGGLFAGVVAAIIVGWGRRVDPV